MRICYLLCISFLLASPASNSQSDYLQTSRTTNTNRKQNPLILTPPEFPASESIKAAPTFIPTAPDYTRRPDWTPVPATGFPGISPNSAQSPLQLQSPSYPNEPLHSGYTSPVGQVSKPLQLQSPADPYQPRESGYAQPVGPITQPQTSQSPTDAPPLRGELPGAPTDISTPAILPPELPPRPSVPDIPPDQGLPLLGSVRPKAPLAWRSAAQQLSSPSKPSAALSSTYNVPYAEALVALHDAISQSGFSLDTTNNRSGDLLARTPGGVNLVFSVAESTAGITTISGQFMGGYSAEKRNALKSVFDSMSLVLNGRGSI